MSNDPNTLKISVTEDVGLKDVPPGTPKKVFEQQKQEKLPPEELEKRQKIMLEYTRLLGRYCLPHNKKSRWVNNSDIQTVLRDGKDLVAMCNLPRGKYSGIMALAHSQIDDKDPLRFFTLPSGVAIINPVIINHTRVTVSKKEGCMSFPDKDIKENVQRYNKVTVIYQTLERKDEKSEPVFSKPITEKMEGGTAHVFQHELSHLNGSNIYDANFKSESAIGFGDGLIVEEEIKKLYK